MTPEIITGDCLNGLKSIPDNTVQTAITSPPYWGLRDYGVSGQLGNEKTPEQFVSRLCNRLNEVHRVLKPDGTLWLNLGDTYFKKQLAGIPWQVAFELKRRGWLLRSDIIWAKPNPTPESVKDRPTKAHEYIFLMSKSEKYKYNAEAILEPLAPSSLEEIKTNYRGTAQKDYLSGGAQDPSAIKKRMLERWREKLENGEPIGANKKSVWQVKTPNCKGEHFATFPEELIKPCVLAGSDPGDIVLDPFNGTGTTGLVSLELGRNYIGCEINAQYVTMTNERLSSFQFDLFERAPIVSDQPHKAREKTNT